MKHIKLFEQFIPKLNNEPIEVSSIGTFGQRITNKGTKKIKKQDIIFATNDTIEQIVRDEIKRLGKDADLNHINVSQVTNMDSVFSGTNFQGDISQWDVSNVITMGYMFYCCDNFNCDLSNWKVGNVKYMSYMFNGCTNFNQDISNWNVRSAITMYEMFGSCTNFNQDISKWDVSNVTDMRYMFEECTNFNQDISNWNVENVKEMYGVFYRCPIKEEYKPKFK